MCRERKVNTKFEDLFFISLTQIEEKQVDNTANEQYNQLLEQLRKLNKILYLDKLFLYVIIKITN